MSSSSFKCVFCSKYLASGTSPRQASCGERLCGDCWTELGRQGEKVQCPACSDQIVLAESFRDKAVEQEVATLVVPCSNKDCPWNGEYKYLKEHTSVCRFGMVECPNSGCGRSMRRDMLKEHRSRECVFEPVACPDCNKMVSKNLLNAHRESECPAVEVRCPNDCGYQGQRRMLAYHLDKECQSQIRQCSHIHCSFKGTQEQISQHETRDIAHHVQCLERAYQQHFKINDGNPQGIESRLQALELQAVERGRVLTRIKNDLALKLQPVVNAVERLEPVVNQLQEGFSEMALLVQTLQATSYNGLFTWKIPEILRRRNEAVTGKTISLYSAPFYTSRHGYKLCLRLYMDGDGSGKGTHLSYFITIMRGEYDALLPWPFKQTVTLMLLDQDKQKDIVQSFRPEPSSSSFQRPRNEMNVASGCPTFASISILNNTSYVKDDTMFLRCKIDTAGLEAHI